jgi:anaerobic nitric oxide reductase transcription regulator
MMMSYRHRSLDLKLTTPVVEMTTTSLETESIALLADLGGELSREGRYRRLLESVQRLVPCDATALLQLEGDTLVPLAVDGLTEDALGRRFAVADHPRLARFIAANGSLRLHADCDLPDPYDGLVEAAPELSPVHDCIGAPLRVDGRLWGLLTLDALSPRAFDEVGAGHLRSVVALAEKGVRAVQRFETRDARSESQRPPTRTPRSKQRKRPMIGKSPALQTLLREVAMVAASDLPVLILGETGVGKELIAECLHEASPRRERPLVHVNCAALPESLAESELFGHCKGAFTGATEDRAGKFELAHGGTLLLDEVGELPLPVQAKLLRVLQSGEIQRPGSDARLHVDVRVISATNRDLRHEVSQGRFREDLYYRLSVFPLRVPPLRERGKDVLLLAGNFLEENQQRLGASNFRLTLPAKQALQRYEWPGNVRELEHVMSGAALRAIAAQGRRTARWISIDVTHLALESTTPTLASATEAGVTASDSASGLREAVDAFQRGWIREALRRNQGNLAATARAAGMDRGNFHRLVKRLGIQLP